MQTSSFFAAYASLAGSMMLIRSMANDMNLMIPGAIRDYIQSAIHYLFAPLSTKLTIVIDEQCGMNGNQIYEAADVYLRTRISPKTERFKVYKTPKQRILNTSIAKDEVVVDTFQGCQLSWTLVTVEQNKFSAEKRFFELSFDKKFKEQVLTDYLPFVLAKAKEIKDSDRVVKLYTRDCPYYSDDDGNYGGGGGVWGAISLDHPSTFETLAMDPEMKKAIIDDLDRFLKRREFYKKVGKAWKRGYLLYGPPGTGKSSLIAAMANHLKFDVYDLELTSLYSNSELRRILISTTNRSIIVIEDIDCSVEMHDREKENHDPPSSNSKFTLSGLLNFIDGLWSSCGDERIIVFTTNHKDRLDPALLRPGRMDMHIHMSYLTTGGFRLLASNYFGVGDKHKLFGEIEGLIKNIQVTPAEIAEELLRSEDTDNALTGVVNLLKRKRIESKETNQEKTNEFGVLEGSPDAKRVKKEENLKRVRALRSTKGMRVIEGRGGRGKGRGRRR